MARDPELFRQQKERIVAYYKKWDTKREFGVKKHTNAWCIAKAAHHFGLSPATVSGYLYRN